MSELIMSKLEMMRNFTKKIRKRSKIKCNLQTLSYTLYWIFKGKKTKIGKLGRLSYNYPWKCLLKILK